MHFFVVALKIVFMSTKKTAPPPDGEAASYPLEGLADRYLEQANVEDVAQARFARAEIRDAFMLAFGQQCRLAREKVGMEIGDAAHKLGMHRNTVWNIERGDSLPDILVLEMLARIYQTTPTQLLSSAGSRSAGAVGMAKNVRAVQEGGYIYVPEFDVHASAGNGFFNDLESVVAMRPFDESYIRGELGIQHDEIALIKVIGRSMEPDLRSRDTTLVDLQDRDVLTEGIHILRLDGALLIKKVQRLPGRVLRVSSSNPSFESFDIHGNDDADRDFAVLGRVRWAGVTFS